jgi:hypothetical protein
MTYLFNYKNHVLRIASLCITMVFARDNLFAQGAYKWVDKQGKVHFGDKRNAPNSSKEIEIKSVKKASTSSMNIPALIEPFRTYQVPKLDIAPSKPIEPIVSIPSPMMPDHLRMSKPEKWPEYKTRMPDRSPENAPILALGETVLKKCIVLAVDLHDMDFGVARNAAHDHYLASCPKVKVECNAYRKKPAMNICEAKAVDEKGAISVFKTTD